MKHLIVSLLFNTLTLINSPIYDSAVLSFYSALIAYNEYPLVKGT